MTVHIALGPRFEEQVGFRLKDGTPIEGSVFIGETEFLAVETLRDDSAAYRAEFGLWLANAWLPEQEERRYHLLQLHSNAQRYRDLQEAVERQQVVPFIGSGMSVPSGFPTWADMLRKITQSSRGKLGTIERLLRSGKFEEAAELVSSGVNQNLFNECILHGLRVNDPSRIDGPVRLLPITFPQLVVTTNLDDVLEQYYPVCDLAFTHVLPGKDVARYRGLKTPKERFLLKLHGDCRDPSTRVLLKSEYDSAYAPGSVTREELTLLYRNNHLLFLGCSLLADRTVQLIEEVAHDDRSMPKHYAFLALPSSRKARLLREHFLTDRGIFPIWYDLEHDESIMALLSGLVDVLNPTYIFRP